MDIEKLIEQLRNAGGGPEGIKMCQDAATALSTLQAENEMLRAELEQKENYYRQMIDALAATDSTELEQVKRERDAAINDLGTNCYACIHQSEATWPKCPYSERDGDSHKCLNYKWRGLEEE